MPRFIFVGALFLFLLIGAISLFKRGGEKKEESKIPVKETSAVAEASLPQKIEEKIAPALLSPIKDEITEEEVDQVWRLFTKGKKKLPIVETVKYKSRVPWIEGKPAWISDYASYYGTSRHFIARSLNGKPDYATQRVSFGDQFNVFAKGKEVYFYLVIDLSRCKMWFYYHDLGSNEKVLLKTYHVGLGRFDPHKFSGLLTPLGKYRLGDKVAIYRPGVKGHFQGEEREMVEIFGNRWLPFVEEVSGMGEDPRGYGLHGAPWSLDPRTNSYVENQDVIGKYESDGCIRLKQEDVEELFAIVITKPTFVEIVKDFRDAKIPGFQVEK
ncbi:MAG: L,D-transpeptidase family protein [Simkania negevensis]|nr:L,D-transpeptidase family protein [Simkania negevensis]